jgi:hypothetical protein
MLTESGILIKLIERCNLLSFSFYFYLYVLTTDYAV